MPQSQPESMQSEEEDASPVAINSRRKEPIQIGTNTARGSNQIEKAKRRIHNYVELQKINTKLFGIKKSLKERGIMRSRSQQRGGGAHRPFLDGEENKKEAECWTKKKEECSRGMRNRTVRVSRECERQQDPKDSSSLSGKLVPNGGKGVVRGSKINLSKTLKRGGVDCSNNERVGSVRGDGNNAGKSGVAGEVRPKHRRSPMQLLIDLSRLGGNNQNMQSKSGGNSKGGFVHLPNYYNKSSLLREKQITNKKQEQVTQKQRESSSSYTGRGVAIKLEEGGGNHGNNPSYSQIKHKINNYRTQNLQHPPHLPLSKSSKNTISTQPSLLPHLLNTSTPNNPQTNCHNPPSTKQDPPHNPKYIQKVISPHTTIPAYPNTNACNSYKSTCKYNNKSKTGNFNNDTAPTQSSEAVPSKLDISPKKTRIHRNITKLIENNNTNR